MSCLIFLWPVEQLHKNLVMSWSFRDKYTELDANSLPIRDTNKPRSRLSKFKVPSLASLKLAGYMTFLRYRFIEDA